MVNSSWALPETLDQCFTEFEPDIELLEAAGIAVVFSAGNQGPWPSSSVSPSNNAGVIATGGVDEALEVASFSGRGPGACDGGVYPEMVAPAVNVRTSDLTFGGLFPNSYVSVTGTSFGAPHVSGGIALLLGAFPDASVDDAKWALETAALDLGASGPDDDYGHGLIDLVAAHAALSEVPTCKDGDADGFFAEEGCGNSWTATTRTDFTAAACDVKRDGIDQDLRRRGRAGEDDARSAARIPRTVALAWSWPFLPAELRAGTADVAVEREGASLPSSSSSFFFSCRSSSSSSYLVIVLVIGVFEYDLRRARRCHVRVLVGNGRSRQDVARHRRDQKLVAGSASFRSGALTGVVMQKDLHPSWNRPW